MPAFDVLVVGGGAAGLAAAVFTAQAGLRTCVLDAGESTMKETRHIQNYLGFPRYVGGEELLALGREHVKRFDGELATARVTGAARDGDRFRLDTGAGAFDGRYLILSTGHSVALADDLDLDTVPGRGGYFPERHVQTDDAGRAAPGVYAAGLARRWEYQAQVTAGDGARAAVTLLSDHFGKPYVGHT